MSNLFSNDSLIILSSLCVSFGEKKGKILDANFLINLISVLTSF